MNSIIEKLKLFLFVFLLLMLFIIIMKLSGEKDNFEPIKIESK